jgi:hypothetical protein
MKEGLDCIFENTLPPSSVCWLIEVNWMYQGKLLSPSYLTHLRSSFTSGQWSYWATGNIPRLGKLVIWQGTLATGISLQGRSWSCSEGHPLGRHSNRTIWWSWVSHPGHRSGFERHSLSAGSQWWYASPSMGLILSPWYMAQDSIPQIVWLNWEG